MILDTQTHRPGPELELEPEPELQDWRAVGGATSASAATRREERGLTDDGVGAA